MTCASDYSRSFARSPDRSVGPAIVCSMRTRGMLTGVTRSKHSKHIGAAVFAAAAVVCSTKSSARPQLELITLPKGFSISVFADNIPDARSMALAPDGTVFVGNRDKDKVYAIAGGQPVVLARGFNTPNGAIRDGSLYVAEVNRVLRYDRVLEWLQQPSSGRQPLKPALVSDKFPSDSHH